MLGLLLTLSLAQCVDLDARGSQDRAQACYVDIVSAAEDPLQVAQAYGRLGNLDAANEWFRLAQAQQPENPSVRTAWGRLFQSVHQGQDAATLMHEALSLDPDNLPAKVALAEIYAERFESGARELLDEVLDVQPDHVAAQLLAARLYLEVGDSANAGRMLSGVEQHAELSVKEHLDALALQAALVHMESPATAVAAVPGLAGAITKQALAINPRFGDIYAVPAYFYVITRRYQEAVALLESAIAIEPDLWQARSDLGVNLLRINRLDDARVQLEAAFAGDPYDAITVNTLRLLDSLDAYDTTELPGLVLRTNPAETAALRPAVTELVQLARQRMAPRYDFEFVRPVVIELYEHHDDFAVRTAGLPGIGILGAAFGDVVVMDGPAAKGIHEGFDWASALWHEIAHVVTLGLTSNRVSRWFSEGVSELEEWETGPTPRRSISVSFLQAWREDRLLPVAMLDEGFIRPTYPGQIMVSYVQAGLVCQFVNREFEDGLVRMLAVYAEGGDTVQAVSEGLSITPQALDIRFAAYLEERFAAIGDGLEQFQTASAAAAAARARQDWPIALEQSRLAVALYPDYVELDSPYPALIAAASATGDWALAESTARAYFAAGGRQPDALALLAERSEGAERLSVLRALARTRPLALEAREALGDGLIDTGDYAGAAIEYAALLSLEPHDRASAHYRLATALNGLGERDDARRELLLALEIAPRYGDALSLLLELQD